MPAENVALRLIISVVVVMLSAGPSGASHPVHVAQYPATPVPSQYPATRAQMGYRYPSAPVGQPAPYYRVNTSISEMAAEIAELKAWKAQVLAADAASKEKVASERKWKIGGRVYFDTAMFSQNDQSLAQGITARNGTEIRRAWLSVSGEASPVLDYCLQLEFAGSKTVSGTRFQSTCFKDAYLGFRDLPYVGNIRIGHICEPLSLEQMTSNRYITFMERSCLQGIWGSKLFTAQRMNDRHGPSAVSSRNRPRSRCSIKSITPARRSRDVGRTFHGSMKQLRGGVCFMWGLAGATEPSVMRPSVFVHVRKLTLVPTLWIRECCTYPIINY